MRCYNGAPDSQLKKFIDDDNLATRQLAERGLRAVYFPVEEGFMLFKGYQIFVNQFFWNKRSAVNYLGVV